MTLDKFRDAYREASKELPQISISAEEIRDELHHRRMQRQSRKILMAKGCAAAAVFLLCGVGTVAAKSYRDSMITVRENGFVITSSQEEPNLSEGQFGGLLDIASFLKVGLVPPVFRTGDCGVRFRGRVPGGRGHDGPGSGYEPAWQGFYQRAGVRHR